MDRQPTQERRPDNPRRKQKTKAEIFRETYLPFLIIAVAVLAVIAIVVGIVSAISKRNAANSPEQSIRKELEQQASALLTQAEELATVYDYDGALEILNSFEGEAEDFPKIQEAIATYTLAKDSMVAWTASQVPNLSFHTLVVDLEAALADADYGTEGSNQYNTNFVTVREFYDILQQLYDGGYVLVDLDDLYTYDEAAGTYAEQKLYLPAGKKPILLTQTHCSYYSYMEDCHGFATKLLYSESKGFYNQYVTADGQSLTGNYDLVPVLESFLRSYPDFSYQGARAILAISGYDGVFGYRVTSETLSDEALAQERADATALAQALREAGYTIACYTYNNLNYSTYNAQAIGSDIWQWQTHIASVVGQTDILVFAQGSDIGTSYEDNEKFDTLYESGFRYFLGSASFISCQVSDSYVRHSRLMVTGYNLCYHSGWFDGILTTDGLLDDLRSGISE